VVCWTLTERSATAVRRGTPCGNAPLGVSWLRCGRQTSFKCRVQAIKVIQSFTSCWARCSCQLAGGKFCRGDPCPLTLLLDGLKLVHQVGQRVGSMLRQLRRTVGGARGSTLRLCRALGERRRRRGLSLRLRRPVVLFLLRDFLNSRQE
jgi:hypothetical protein